jgi:signal transduction histidine kinase
MTAGRILIVDDDAMNQEILARRLRKMGCEVRLAGDGLEALELLAAEPHDLVLLDLLMPGMSGFEVLDRMQQDPALRRIPVIVVSAMDELEDAVRCIEKGATDHLPKPCNPVLLAARVNASLEQKRFRDRELALYEQLQVNFKKLQELETLRDNLTHMIVHDLRSPLASVMAGLEMVQGKGNLSSVQDEILKLAIENSRHLLDMIGNVLDVSKMEGQTIELSREEVRVPELISGAIAEVSAAARRQHLQLSAEVASGLPRLSGDTGKLRRVLVNLLGNALKFTPAGGSIVVKAGVDPATGEFLLEVADSGEGIPEEEFDRIFDKFGQVATRKAGRKMSTGLGLTFCKMAVEAHGGRITVASELGKGTTFTVRLSAARAAD